MVLDKPQGVTSTQAVTRVRRLFDAAKAGHAGTLDPLATGVLAVALGEATKTVPFRTFLSKTEAAANNQVFPVYNDDARKVVEALSLKSGVINLFAAFNPHLQNPYSMNIYFGVQRALSSSWMLESAFVGTRGVKFPLERVFNPVDRLTGLRPATFLLEWDVAPA